MTKNESKNVIFCQIIIYFLTITIIKYLYYIIKYFKIYQF